MKKLFFFLFLIISGIKFLEVIAAEGLPAPHVRLQILDKVTGHTQIVEVHHQEAIVFGTLKIHVYRCHRSSPQEIPWSTAYMDVWEEDIYQGTHSVYSGWIFSSSPATIEHSVYDIRLLECLQCTTCCQNTPVSLLKIPKTPAATPQIPDIISDE